MEAIRECGVEEIALGPRTKSPGTDGSNKCVLTTVCSWIGYMNACSEKQGPT